MLIVAYGLIHVMNKHVYTHIKNKNITWQISAFFAAFFTLLYLDQNSSSASLAYYRRGRNWGSALDETANTEVLCCSRCGTVKTSHCSKALSAIGAPHVILCVYNIGISLY